MKQTTIPGMSANDITRSLLMEIPKRFPGARAWRRNVGEAYGSHLIQQVRRLLEKGASYEALATLKKMYPIQFGMPGEGDIDGFIPVCGAAVRLSVEVKAGKDKVRESQANFNELLLMAGGISVIALDVAMALDDIAKQVEAVERRMKGE